MGESRKKFVIDASVAIKWLIYEEEYLEQALKIKKDYENKKIDFHIPSHFYSEVGNTIGRKMPGSASYLFSILEIYRLREYNIGIKIASMAFELMQKHSKISFYDAAYHALAINEGATFVTADENYYKTAKASGSIMLLKNYC